MPATLPLSQPEPHPHDGPTAAEAAAQARASRQSARSAAELIGGLAALADAVQARVSPGRDVGATRAAVGTVEALLATLAALLTAPHPELPEEHRDATLAALNGVFGDRLAHLASPLATRMAFRHGGQPLALERAALARAMPQAGGKLLVLIHDLGADGRRWHGTNGQDHGDGLPSTLGFTPLTLHYNSGLHVSTNGRALAARLVELLDRWPHPLARFAIVAHGLGGLLARSALHHGLAAGHHWPHRLDDLATLGTPHHGASLGPAGAGPLLGAAPFGAAFARLAGLRSAGIDDLRHGNLLDEDWSGGPRTAASLDPRQAVPLPAGTRCHAIAGAVDGPGAPGDGLVPVASALGKHRLARRTLRFLPGHQRVLHGLDHAGLLSSPLVAAQLCEWLAA